MKWYAICVFKGSVKVILSDSPCKDGKAWFITVPLTDFSDLVWIRYPWFWLLKLFILISWFSAKSENDVIFHHFKIKLRFLRFCCKTVNRTLLSLYWRSYKITHTVSTGSRRTFEFPCRSTLPVPVCTIPRSMDRTSGATRLTRSDFMLHIGWI